MANSNETQDIILDIEVRYEDAIKGIAQYTQKIDELKKEQDGLKKNLKDEIISREEYNKSMAASKAEIDYNKKAVQTLNKEIQNNLKIEREQKGSIDSMKASLSNLTAQYNKLGEEERNATKGNDLNRQITETTAKLKLLEEAHGDHRRSVGDYAKAGKDLKIEMREMIDALTAMKLAGDDNSEQFLEMTARLAELKDAYGDVSQGINALASDTKTLDALSQSIGAVVGAFGAYATVIGLSSEKEKEFASTMKTLQIAMTALASWTQISIALQKQSIIHITAQQILQKIGINQTLAQTKAEAALNVVKGQGTIATKAIAAAQWLWNAALAANPVVLLAIAAAALFVGIKSLTKAFDSSAKAEKEATKVRKEYEEQARKTTAAINNLNNEEKNSTDQRKNQLREEILELKKNGASTEQINKAKEKAERDMRAVQKQASESRIRELNAQEVKLIASLNAEQRVLDILIRKNKQGTDKYIEQKKAVDDLRSSLDALNQSRVDEIQIQANVDLENKEADQDAIDRRNAAAKEYQSKLVEQKNKEREAIRKANDTLLSLLDDNINKQRILVNTNYSRQIEDLNRRLKEEKNLTKTAKEAINQTILNLQKQQQKELDDLSDKAFKDEVDKETNRIQLNLAAIKEGSEQEYQLKLQSLMNLEKAELLANSKLAENLRQSETDIRAKYEKQFEELENKRIEQTLKKQSDAIQTEWKERLMQVQKGSLEEFDLKVQQAQSEYDALLNMDAEQKALMYESDLEYTNALLDNRQKLTDAQKAQTDAINESVRVQLQAAQAIGNGFEQVLNAFAEDSEALAGFAKTIALFNVGLSTAEALAKGVASAQSVGFPLNIPAIATTIGAVMTNIAKAKQLISSSSAPKAPNFATGGTVTGPGSGTSDSIVANLSNGESILTARSTSMFSPVLSALNQMGGGVPINVVQSSQQVMGEEMLARAFAKGVASIPAPVVSVEEINATDSRIQTLENLRLR